MDDLPPAPAGISDDDWRATPPAVRLLVVALIGRLQALEARLNQTSRNSSKPPSSDPPSAPPAPPKVPRGRKAGAQPGHTGATRPVPPPDQVDEHVDIYPSTCPQCQTALGASLPDVQPVVTTYTWELPPVRPHITAYQHHTVACPTCQAHVWNPRRPAGAPPGAFGARATALVALLHGRYRLSDRETADALATVWQFPLSLGSVVACCTRTSAALAPLDAAILAHVQQQDAGHADETGWRVAGRRAWLWTLTTRTATSYRIQAQRSRDAAIRLLSRAWRGVLGCDRWSAYRYLPNDRRQLCWAHLTRNVRACADGPTVASAWGAQVLLHIDTLWQVWAQVRDGWFDHTQLQTAIRPVQQALRDLFERGRTHAWARVQAFCRDVLRQWAALWTFTRVDGVAPTNNAAEQALRPAVLWRKGCFGTRSAAGSQFVERMLSVITTCRQQHRNVFAILTQALERTWAHQPAPDLFSPA